jgi:effector-binding domain-containing protein
MKLLIALLFALLMGCSLLSFSAANDLDFTASEFIKNKVCDTTIKPFFSLEKMNLLPMQVLTIADTATSASGIGPLLGKCYGELFRFINQQQLQPWKIMAFYYSSHEPFVFYAAVEVNKLPDELNGRIKAKTIAGGDVIVVHYQGAYDQIAVAYTAIAKWLVNNNKKALDAPFEVYLNDPSTVKDPALLCTDVYQKIK